MHLSPSAPLAAAVFLAAVALVITRPRGLTEAWAALLGAIAMVVLGLVPLAAVPSIVASQWNVLSFFFGLTGIAAVAERSGLFERLAWQAARWSRGDPRRLLLAVVLAGGIVSALLSNDAAALVLTPVVYALVARVGLEPMPYVLACTFVADAASVALPVSNPVNVIVADGLRLHPVALAPVTLPAALGSVAALLAVLAWRYLPRLPARTPVPISANLAPAPPTRTQRQRWAALALVGVAFAAASLAGVPLGPTMLLGWLVLAGVERAGGRHGSPLEGIGWSLLVFVAAMTVAVQGLAGSGITAWLAELVLRPLAGSPPLLLGASALLGAIGANLLNNLPAALVLVDAVRSAGLTPVAAHAAALGTMVGADLGPNLTPVGSVATLLWLVLLRQRGLEVSSWSYIRLGLIVTPLTAGAALTVVLILGGAR